MIRISNLSSDGHLVIPAAIREELSIAAGDLLEINLVGGRMIIDPVVGTPKKPGEVAEIVAQIKTDRAGLLGRLAYL